VLWVIKNSYESKSERINIVAERNGGHCGYWVWIANTLIYIDKKNFNNIKLKKNLAKLFCSRLYFHDYLCANHFHLKFLKYLMYALNYLTLILILGYFNLFLNYLRY
jgi:hypothetical protein